VWREKEIKLFEEKKSSDKKVFEFFFCFFLSLALSLFRFSITLQILVVLTVVLFF